MNKPIFENGKEAILFINEIIQGTEITSTDYSKFIENIENKGYILKTALEETEEKYLKIENKILDDYDKKNNISICIDYIDELKKEIERLKR